MRTANISALVLLLWLGTGASAEGPQAIGDDLEQIGAPVAIAACTAPDGPQTPGPVLGEASAASANDPQRSDAPECPSIAPCNAPCQPSGPCTYENLGIARCRMGSMIFACDGGQTIHRERCAACRHAAFACWAISPVYLVCRDAFQRAP